jgi:hypothetical protein
LTLLRREPEDLGDFHCTACGGCCGLWNIMIDDAAFERASRFIETSGAGRPNPELPWFVTIQNQHYYAMTPQGRCVFVDAENLCWLHRHDPLFKSDICRTFPIELTRTPDGCDRSLSFASLGAFRHVLLNGKPFRIVEWRTSEKIVGKATEPHPIKPLPELDWRTFFEVERRLLGFLASGSDLESDLLAAGRFLVEVEARARDKTLAKAMAEGLHPKRQSIANAVSDIDAAQRLLTTILDLRLKTIEFETARQDIVAFLARLADEREMSRLARYRRLRRRFWLPSAPALEAVLRKFILYKIFQKKSHLEFGLVRGQNMIAFHVALIRLHALLACDRDAPLQPEDLFPSIEFVERQFSHALHFSRFWHDLFKGRHLDTAELGEMLILG